MHEAANVRRRARGHRTRGYVPNPLLPWAPRVSRPRRVRRASHWRGEVSHLDHAGRSRLSTDIVCDGRDRVLRARTQFASPRPSLRDRSTTTTTRALITRFLFSSSLSLAFSSLSSRSQARSWRKAWRARA